jgi:hypothetical protein
VQLLYVRHQPRVAHRSPPCSFFYKCILQGAIDFAELRNAELEAWSECGAECRTLFGVAGFAPDPNFEQTFGFKDRKNFPAFSSLTIFSNPPQPL